MEALRYEFYIGGTPEQVWKVLIDPNETKKIYHGSVIESTFEIGSPFSYIGPGINGDRTNQLYGEILAFNKYELFSHTVKIDTIFGPEHEGYSSRITYRLDKVGLCTKLSVVHDNWMTGDPSHQNTSRNWWMLLSSIKSLVETGNTLDFGFGSHVGSGD